MDIQVALLITIFLLCLMMNVPIAICIALSTFFTIITLSDLPSCYIIAQQIATGIRSFPLLAIPFFILSGILMGQGGMASRLIHFATVLLGRFTGGLSYVNTMTCMMFGAISGSATAAVSSIGGFMIPEMNAKGYDRDFNVAVTTTAATTGLLIPPSNVMIVYAVVTGNVSVAAMFMAGILPGIIVGLAIMLVCGMISIKNGYGAGTTASFREVIKAFSKAFLSLLLVIIVLGGILGGIFSATEASAIAVLYAFILAVFVYKQVKIKDFPAILMQCSKTTAIVMFLIGASKAMSWLLAYQQIPQNVSTALLGISENPIVIFIIINILLLAVGTFMDMTPAVLVFTPIFLPVVTKLGMHPVHFGIMLIANLCIGLCTPPVGTCLFVGCGVGNTTIANVIKPMIPFFIAMIVALLLITYIPWLSLWIPSLIPSLNIHL